MFNFTHAQYYLRISNDAKNFIQVLEGTPEIRPNKELKDPYVLGENTLNRSLPRLVYDIKDLETERE